MKASETACAWFSAFLLNPELSRVKRLELASDKQTAER